VAAMTQPSSLEDNLLASLLARSLLATSSLPQRQSSGDNDKLEIVDSY